MRLMGAVLAMIWIGGCNQPDFNPNLARGAYPYALHTTETLSVEVFREGTDIVIVNATAESWSDATLWINQRFSLPIEGLEAGETRKLSLDRFRDDLGESFPAGGLFATRRSMPVRLVELQAEEDGPLVGFIAIRQSESQ